MVTPDSVPVEAVRGVLVDWFRSTRRDLPWRSSPPDPYAVWVSEIMLQQTRVAAAEPYYRRWMTRFPTIGALAAADEDDVLRAWAGLGYYARARNLHRAARIVAEACGGQLPRSRDELMRLPGIGRYTAGAILSIAMGRPEPIVDTNVERVLARMTGLAVPAGAARKELWEIAAEFAGGTSPGDINQALMELGALVCRAADPRCEQCPVLRWCAAGQGPDPTAYPLPAPRRAPVAELHACAIVRDRGLVLLARRPPHGLWGGLWEFPRRVCEPGEPPEQCARRALAEIAGLEAGKMEPAGRIRHTVTHHRITLHAFTADNWLLTGTPCSAAREARWMALDAAHDLPLSSPQAALLAAISH